MPDQINPYTDRDHRNESGILNQPYGAVAGSIAAMSIIGFSAHKYYPSVQQSKFAAGTRSVLRGLDRMPLIGGSYPVDMTGIHNAHLPDHARKSAFQRFWAKSKSRIHTYEDDLARSHAGIRRSKIDEILSRLKAI